MRRQKDLLQQILRLPPSDHMTCEAEQSRRLLTVQLFKRAGGTGPTTIGET